MTGVFAVKYWNPPWNIFLKAKLIYHSIYHSLHALLATLTQADPHMEIELTGREYQLLFTEIQPFLQLLGRQHFLFPARFIFSIDHIVNKIEWLEILHFIHLTTHVLCFWIQQFLTDISFNMDYLMYLHLDSWAGILIFQQTYFSPVLTCCNSNETKFVVTKKKKIINQVLILKFSLLPPISPKVYERSWMAPEKKKITSVLLCFKSHHPPSPWLQKFTFFNQSLRVTSKINTLKSWVN